MRHGEFFWQSADGLRLFAQCWQPNEAPLAVVCVVHGVGEHSGRYVEMAEAFTQAGFALLAFDLRGHGKSEGARGDAPGYEVLLNDVGLLLKKARNHVPHCPQYLFGHSMGGNLVLNYTLRRRPEIAGVLVSAPALRLPHKPAAWKLAGARLCYNLWPSLPLRKGLHPRVRTSDVTAVQAYKRDPLSHARISVRLAMDLLASGEWALQHAGEFSLPLLLMHGSADRIASVNASNLFAKRVKRDCVFKLWDEFYHELHSEPQRKIVFLYQIGWLLGHLPKPAHSPLDELSHIINDGLRD